jgi:uncharacterized protein YdhG (YjbR/CyaY superfamily)
MKKTDPTGFDEYARAFPAPTQRALRTMRTMIEEAAPDAVQRISYKMPAYVIDGKVRIWFGAFESHIGLYPGAAAVAAFEDDLTAYKTAKGSIRFPLDQPLPAKLIARIVAFVVREASDSAPPTRRRQSPSKSARKM